MNAEQSASHLKDAVRAGAKAILVCDVADLEAVTKSSQRDPRDVRLNWNAVMGPRSVVCPVDLRGILRLSNFADELVKLAKSAEAERLILCGFEDACAAVKLNPLTARDTLISTCRAINLPVII